MAKTSNISAAAKQFIKSDAAVMEAYGFRKDMTEPEIVAELFKMYQILTTH